MDHCVGLVVNSGRPFSIFKDKEEINNAKVFINQALKKRKILAGVPEQDPDEEIIVVDSENNTNDDGMIQFAGHLATLAQNDASSQTKTRENSSDLQLELMNYEKLPRLPPGEQIMEFWEVQEKFPILKKIAADILSIPVTEVQSNECSRI